jgi:hypothetical protein
MESNATKGQGQAKGQEPKRQEPSDASVMTLDTKGLTAALGSPSDKTTRRFVRTLVKMAGGSVGTDTPGSGGRYSFAVTEAQMAELRERFAVWQAKGAGSRIVGADVLGLGDASDAS